MDIVNVDVEAYAAAHTTPVDPLLAELDATTNERSDRARMLSGPLVGRTLQTLIAVSGARRVLEIGTFTGYSALTMASALPDDGQVVTCDVSEESTAIAREFWARSPHGGKIELRLGPALDTIARSSRGRSTFVFIDADKSNYSNYYEAAWPLLSEHALIIADNTLWSGRVLDPDDEDSRAIVAYNDLVQSDPRVDNVLLTVRDGLMVARRC